MSSVPTCLVYEISTECDTGRAISVTMIDMIFSKLRS